jgi:hypothetical protein
VRLTWSAPDACPRAHDVTARMARLLSRSTAPHPELVAEAQVSAEDAAFALEMRIWQSGRPAYRRLRATSCRELSDAAALLLALLVDPALQIEPEPEPPRAPRGPRSRAAPAPQTNPEPRARTRSSGFVWGAAGGAVLDWAAVPGPAPGLSGAVSGELLRLRVELGALWLPLSKHVVSDAAGESEKGGQFRLIAGSARLCHAFLVSPRLSACAASELGALRASGFGTASDRSRSVVWAAAGPGVVAAIPFAGSAALALGGDLLFALNRPRFELDNVGLAHRPPVAGFRLSAGIQLYFR